MCAAPSYLSARGVPQTSAELSGHTCLTYRRPRNGRIREWRFAEGATVQHMTINGAMTFNSGEALVAVAAAGLGIIQVAEYYAFPLLETGKLVEILGDYKTEGYDISVVFPQQNRTVPKLRVFVDFLVSLFDPPPWTKSAARSTRQQSSVKGSERATTRVS